MRLLLKAIRSLPAGEQDAVVRSLLERSLLPGVEVSSPPLGSIVAAQLPAMSFGTGTAEQANVCTLPVRFPKSLYDRLKEWSADHNFPMAVVVRGLVERFLDEQQRRVA